MIILIPRVSMCGANLFGPIAKSIDPDGLFLWISVHHVFQLGLTLMLMKLFYRATLSMWGFNLNQLRTSLRTFAVFCVLYFLQVFVFNALPDLTSRKLPGFNAPLTAGNAVGVLGFQFLLSGTCEEPLFRGFVMTFLAQSWKGSFRFGKVILPVSGLWATLFFMIAHARISFYPFSVSASVQQQLLALELGFYYAAVFHRTGSLLGPILSHGYSNGVLYVVLFLGTLLSR